MYLIPKLQKSFVIILLLTQHNKYHECAIKLTQIQSKRHSIFPWALALVYHIIYYDWIGSYTIGSIMFEWISKGDAFVRSCDGMRGIKTTSKGFLYNSSNKSIVVFLLFMFHRNMSYHEKIIYARKHFLSWQTYTEQQKMIKEYKVASGLSAFKRHKTVLRFSSKNSNILNTKWHRRTHNLFRCISS